VASQASLRQIAREGPDGFAESKLQLWSASRDPERYLEPMLEYLYGELNRHLQAHVVPRLSRERGVVLEPKSLLGALYMMTAEQLVGVWRPRNA